MRREGKKTSHLHPSRSTLTFSFWKLGCFPRRSLAPHPLTPAPPHKEALTQEPWPLRNVNRPSLWTCPSHCLLYSCDGKEHPSTVSVSLRMQGQENMRPRAAGSRPSFRRRRGARGQDPEPRVRTTAARPQSLADVAQLSGNRMKQKSRRKNLNRPKKVSRETQGGNVQS